MIKIEKDINVVPKSLIPAFSDLFEDENIPASSQTTHSRRLEIINANSYNEKYNDRYKLDDIRKVLNDLYKSKCAFCEQKIEQYHIEHYRPKATYYWLAFSWDNLLMACPRCNQSKGTFFDLEKGNNIVLFINNLDNIRTINNSSAKYDLHEKPLMVNPEVTDPSGYIEFQKDGLIKSKHHRFKYTIQKCKIDRKYLNDERRKLLDIFERDIQSALVDNPNNIEEQQKEIGFIVKKFITDFKDKDSQFLGFRKFAIENYWLLQISQSLI